MLTYTQPIRSIRSPYYQSETMAFSNAANSLRWNYTEAFRHFSSPISNETLAQRFSILTNTWKSDLKFSSSIHALMMNPAYLEIISMGRDVLPYIFNNLKTEGPDHWFVALNIITGVNPVPKDTRGDLKAMTAIWINWAEENGYVTKS